MCSGFLTRTDTNRPIHPQKKTRSMKFWISVEEELYSLYSDNIGADQLLHSYCTADLSLCLPVGKNSGFLMIWHIY